MRTRWAVRYEYRLGRFRLTRRHFDTRELAREYAYPRFNNFRAIRAPGKG